MSYAPGQTPTRTPSRFRMRGNPMWTENSDGEETEVDFTGDRRE
jgi:hypothetical protein